MAASSSDATTPGSLRPAALNDAGRPWRLLDTAPAAGAWNMAMDEALMESVRHGAAPVLRFYRWSPACLSLGRNRPAIGAYDLAALADQGIDVVRRPTGGRAVLHDRELTYSVIMPDGWLGSPQDAYTTINRGLARGLRSLGVHVELQRSDGRPPAAPSLAPCFREPAPGEVVLGGRKLIGSAQVREAGVTLQHGSLLFADDQARIGSLLARAAAAEDAPAVLEEALNPLPAWDTLTAALTCGLEEVIGTTIVPHTVGDAEARGADLLVERFTDRQWTWRR